MKKIFFCCLLFFSLNSYSQRSHESYRKRISQVKTKFDSSDVAAEVEFGKSLAARILGKFKLVENPGLQSYVSTLGAGLAAKIGRPELKYHFAVIDNSEVNAYACPGGYIFITQGAINWMSNEAQLLGVLAHEIAHVNGRHVVKKLKIQGKDGSMLSGLGSMIGGATAAYREALGVALDKAYDLLFSEGLTKKEEHLSDVYAINALQAVGYNWKSYIDLIATLDDAVAKGQGGVVSRTHPQSNDRVALMNARVKTWNLTEKNITNEDRFKKYAKAN